MSHTIRRWLSSVVVMALAATPFILKPYALREAWILLPLAAAALLMHVPRVGAQIVWRAILWLHGCALVMVTLFDGMGEELAFGSAVGIFLPLILMGWTGLDENTGTGRFRPHAFRTTMVLSIGLALADSAVFGVPGIATLQDALRVGDMDKLGVSALLLLSSLVLVLGAFGMYRMKVVGVLLALLGNAAMVAWAMGIHMLDARGLPWIAWTLLAANVGAQLLLQLPLLLAMRLGPAHAATAEKTARAVAGAVIVAMFCLCAAGAYLPVSSFVRDTLR